MHTKIYSGLESEDFELLVASAPPPPPSHPWCNSPLRSLSLTQMSPEEGNAPVTPVREAQSASLCSGVSSPPLNYLAYSIEGGINSSPIAHHTRWQTRPNIQALFWHALRTGGEPAFIHVQFTISDLLNWKQSVGSYRHNL